MRGWGLWGTPQGYLGLLTCSDRGLGWRVEGPSPQEGPSSCGWAWNPSSPRPHPSFSETNYTHTTQHSKTNNLYKLQFVESSLGSKHFPAFCHLLPRGPHERGVVIQPARREGRAGLSPPLSDPPRFALDPALPHQLSLLRLAGARVEMETAHCGPLDRLLSGRQVLGAWYGWAVGAGAGQRHKQMEVGQDKMGAAQNHPPPRNPGLEENPRPPPQQHSATWPPLAHLFCRETHHPPW